jgi:hypothetical protein
VQATKMDFKRCKCHHEYTSLLGGKTFCPLSTSFFRKRFKSKNSRVRISSLSCASQLSCRVLISSASSCFCSAVRPATHASLSNLDADWPLADLADAEPLAAADFGGPKKDVMLLLEMIRLCG